MEDINDEVEAIEAIYCGENEFLLLSKEDSSVTFSITTNPVNNEELKITLTFMLSALSYPNEPPSISVQSQYLNRQECDGIKVFLLGEADSLHGTPMILNLLTSLQEKEINPRKALKSIVTAPVENENLTTCVLQLDHMRNKVQYTKTIKRWCDELEILGRLLFCQRWIFIILQSSERNIKTYIQRNKHQCVDVDSSGHPCKERMLSTLYHGCEDTLAFSSFEVVNLDQQNELRNYLMQHNLSKVYSNYIFPLINKK